MEGAALCRDVPYTTPEQLECAEIVNGILERDDARWRRLFGLIALTIKETENGTAE